MAEAAAVVVVEGVLVEELPKSADILVCLGSTWQHAKGTDSTRDLSQTIGAYSE